MDEEDTSFVMSDLGKTFDRQLVVTSGSYKVLREKGSALVDFDFSNTSWESEMSFKSWCGEDYHNRLNDAKSEFIESFNKYSKGIVLKTIENDCNYRLSLKIEWIGQYNRGWGHLYMVCVGDMVISDIHSGKNLCTIRISYLPGESDYIPSDRLRKCFNAIAFEVTRLKGDCSIR